MDPVSHPDESWKLVMPEELQEKVLREAHDEFQAGHLGVEKTYDRIARDYYWRGLWHTSIVMYDLVTHVNVIRSANEENLV